MVTGEERDAHRSRGHFTGTVVHSFAWSVGCFCGCCVCESFILTREGGGERRAVKTDRLSETEYAEGTGAGPSCPAGGQRARPAPVGGGRADRLPVIPEEAPGEGRALEKPLPPVRSLEVKAGLSLEEWAQPP